MGRDDLDDAPATAVSPASLTPDDLPPAQTAQPWRTGPVEAATTVVVVCVFLGVAWRSAAFRGLLERVDRHLVAGLYIVLALLVVGTRLWSLRPRGGARFAPLARFAGPSALAGSMLTMTVPVFAAWHRGKAFSMIGGVVPWGDAHLYVGGAERLLFFDDLDGFNSRRPFNAVYLAVRLAASRLDLRIAVLLGVLMLGVAAFVAARAVARDLGGLAGAALFVGAFGFIHYYLPTTLSETFGVTLGMLAFAAVWNAVRYGSRRLAVASVLLIAIALGARAGVFMLSVLMALWLARRLRTAGWLDLRVLGASAVAIVLGVGLTFATVSALGGDRGSTFGNAGFLLYGMAKGEAAWDAVNVAWVRVYTDHPEIIAMSDGQRNRYVNSLAREEIVANPARFVRATGTSYRNYLTTAKQVILAPWSVGRHRLLMLGAALAVAAAVALRMRRGRAQQLPPDLALFACSILAIPALMSITPGLVPPLWLAPALVAVAWLSFVVIGSRVLPVAFPIPLTLVAFAAVVISLPFIGTDAVRVFADGIGFMTVPLVLAVVILGGARQRRPVSELTPVGRAVAPLRRERDLVPAPGAARVLVGALPVLVAGTLLATMAFGVPVAKAVVNLPDLPPRQCADGRAAQPLVGGVAVRIVSDPTGSNRTVDELGLAAFARQAPTFAPAPFNHLARITGPATLIGGLTPDAVDRFAIVDDQVDAPRTSVLYLCGGVERDPVTDAIFSVLTNPADVFRGVPLDAGR